MSTTAIVSTTPTSRLPAYPDSGPVPAPPFADSIYGASFEQNSAQAQDASTRYRSKPAPHAEDEILTFGRVAFSGGAGSVLIALQAERSALSGAAGLEADRGFATYRFAQALVPDTNSETLGTVVVDNPHTPHISTDELPLAA